MQTAGVTFTAGADSATHSTVTAAPASVTANGSSTSTVTVTLKDAFGNPVGGKDITLAAASGSSTITTVSGTTDGSGHASFTVKDTVAEGVTYTATVQPEATSIVQTAAVAFVPGPVSAGVSTVTASPAAVVADGSATSTVTAT